jgi:hypothetical protein
MTNTEVKTTHRRGGLPVACSLIVGAKIALAGTCKGAETDPRAEFGKETIAGAHQRPKWIHSMVQGCLRAYPAGNSTVKGVASGSVSLSKVAATTVAALPKTSALTASASEMRGWSFGAVVVAFVGSFGHAVSAYISMSLV